MATWTFDDGSELRSGGVVRGKGLAAEKLQVFLADPDRPVHVGPRPMRPVQLDVKSDYLLHFLALDVAFRARTRVRSDYQPRDEDAPPEAREIIEAAKRSARNDPSGTVY